MNETTPTHSGFLARLIALCAGNPLFTILLIGAAAGWGVGVGDVGAGAGGTDGAGAATDGAGAPVPTFPRTASWMH